MTDQTRSYTLLTEETWKTIRYCYEGGDTAADIAAQFGASVRAIRQRARLGGWLRCDMPADAPLPPVDDTRPDLYEAADEALERSLTAAGRDHAGEAARWLRLHDAYQGFLPYAERRRRIDRIHGEEGSARVQAEV